MITEERLRKMEAAAVFVSPPEAALEPLAEIRRLRALLKEALEGWNTDDRLHNHGEDRERIRKEAGIE